MFDVLMYLFETYIHNEAEMRVDQDRLTRDLTDAGFEREDIYNALLWLEKLADYQEGLVEPMQLASDPLSVRIYTAEECERLDASCRGFVLFLEQIQVLNLETREMVIERVMALDTAEFELEDLKWVILMVLFNIPGCENAYQQMEELLFEVNEGMLHKFITLLQELLWPNQHFLRCAIMSPVQNVGLNLSSGPGNTVRFSVVHTIQNVALSVP